MAHASFTVALCLKVGADTFRTGSKNVGPGVDKGAPLTLVESARPSSWWDQGILLGDFAGRSAVLKLMC